MMNYNAPWWLPGGNLQTIYAALRSRRYLAEAPSFRRDRVFPDPGVRSPGEPRAPGLHAAKQQIILAADVVAQRRERRLWVGQTCAPQEAVAAAVVVVDQPLARPVADAGEEPFEVGAVLAHPGRGAAAHRAEHHIGVVLDLGGQQGGEPAVGRLLVVVQEGDGRTARLGHGGVAGVGDAGVGFVDIDHRERRLGR